MPPSQLPKHGPQHELRRLARMLTLAERGDPVAPEFGGGQPARFHPPVLGVTGPPGAGKSTLISQIIRRLRAQGETVAVLAIDPSSPRHGGALLGDRIRMQAHAGDAGVFIRSLSSQGAAGGLAPGLGKMLAILAETGFQNLMIETVGVGQDAVALRRWADICLLVLTPAAGDGIQAMKAGIIEIADIIAVNQAEAGAERLLQDLKESLPTGHSPELHASVATEPEGAAALLDAVIRRLREIRYGRNQ